MSVLESQWWMLELPDEWQASQEEEMIIITDQDGVGEIVITTLEKEEGDVSERELRSFTEELGDGSSVSVSGMDGYYYAYQEDNDALREWYLKADNLLIFITYACDLENAGMDDGAVDEILSTFALRVKE